MEKQEKRAETLPFTVRLDSEKGMLIKALLRALDMSANDLFTEALDEYLPRFIQLPQNQEKIGSYIEVTLPGLAEAFGVELDVSNDQVEEQQAL